MRFFSNTTLENQVCRPKSGINLYPFGQSMPGRTWIGSAGKYRYGMNGQESENEIAQGIYTAEFWEYDSRLGRRWETDPAVFPWHSPYMCFNANPIYFADPSGLIGEDPPTNSKGSVIGTNNDAVNLLEVEVFSPPTVGTGVDDIKTAGNDVNKVDWDVSITYANQGDKGNNYSHFDQNNNLTSTSGKYTTAGNNPNSFYKNVVSYNLEVYPDRFGDYSNGKTNYYNIQVKRELDGKIINRDLTAASTDPVTKGFNKDGANWLLYKKSSISDLVNMTKAKLGNNQTISCVYVELSVAKTADNVNNFTQFKQVIREYIISQLGKDVSVVFTKDTGGKATAVGGIEDGVKYEEKSVSTMRTSFEVITIERNK